MLHRSSTLLPMISAPFGADFIFPNLNHFSSHLYPSSVTTISTFTGTTTTVTSSNTTIHSSSPFASVGQLTASTYAQRPISSYVVSPSTPPSILKPHIPVCSEPICFQPPNAPYLPSAQCNPDNYSKNSAHGVHARFPTISLPTFDGDPLQWDDFIDAYEIAVHNRSIPDQEKMILLRQSLSGRAKLSISKFRSSHYLNAYEHIKSRFGKSHLVVHQLVNELSAMPQATDNLLSLRDTVDRIQAIVTLIDGYKESTNESVLHLLTNKFNLKLRTKIAKAMIRDQSGSKWSVSRLLTFSELYLMEQEELLARLNSPSLSESPTLTTNHVSVQTSPSIPKQPDSSDYPSNSRTCIFCNSFCSTHSSIFCPVYRRLDDRKQRLMKQGRCLNCSREGHIARECDIGPCPRCDHSRLHSKLICPSLVQNARTRSSSRHRVRRSKSNKYDSLSSPSHSSPISPSALSDKERRNEHESSRYEISASDKSENASDDEPPANAKQSGDRRNKLLNVLIHLLRSDNLL